jgi:hypothetical protein
MWRHGSLPLAEVEPREPSQAHEPTSRGGRTGGSRHELELRGRMGTHLSREVGSVGATMG